MQSMVIVCAQDLIRYHHAKHTSKMKRDIRINGLDALDFFEGERFRELCEYYDWNHNAIIRKLQRCQDPEFCEEMVKKVKNVFRNHARRR